MLKMLIPLKLMYKSNTILMKIPAGPFFWPQQASCGILVSWKGTEPGLSPMKAWSPNHWTSREFPQQDIFFF